ncbi:3-oxoacyl-ACP reductase [Kistimonas asteriae]|uniref:3-oxoacyl-ACP reductase n=1 Tax=Kistimonas asteriae TaxID=517724 RepID=UPI001BA8DEDE|nr:3-oxoacyl-ACP reductase [Kistimonas asteriae]
MPDKYQKFANSSLGKSLFSALGLPTPVPLERQNTASNTIIQGKVLLGAADKAELVPALAKTLYDGGVEFCRMATSETADLIADAVTAIGGQSDTVDLQDETGPGFKGLVFDASGIASTVELRALHAFFSPVVRQVQSCGRIVILGRPVVAAKTPSQAAAMRALEGFVRSLAKEVGRKGITVQLIYVAQGAETLLASPLRFCLSARSAYVSAQVITVDSAQGDDALNWQQPLSGKVALVTGASRGIGEAIAGVLARDGATVVCLDIPVAAQALEAVAASINGKTLAVDITDDKAGETIADALAEISGGVDIVVHNAGITRDKTLARMKPEWWDSVMDINLCSEERINEALLVRNLLRPGGRIVCVSSMSGIAGNFGQTNYAASKAGVIGYVQAMAKPLAEKQITINAVAPGFIETQMTAAIPLLTREAGRRMNSLSQGGLPEDVAETIAFFASPASAGVNGNVIRVCGQSLLGA